MRKSITNALSNIFSRRESRDGQVLYELGRLSIYLPRYHRLPEFQGKHRQYDRFLPHLVKELSRDEIVVDVGANCGDTLAGMVSKNPTLHYICIEPDEEFFGYLVKNTARIKQRFPDASIDLIQCLISDSEVAAGLTGEGGTKHRDQTAEGGLMQPSRLEDVVGRLGVTKDVRLIKSDVDGYDYDVINSARQLLACERVMLFFECQYFDMDQREGFIRLLAHLAELGFSDFRFFDNFGAFILSANDSKLQGDLIDYVMRQNQKRATRTIHYFDVLASKPSDHIFLSAVIDQYLRSY
jgi:FkbM family methyltransferase